MTLKEHNDKLRALKRRLAIWEAMHHLMDDKFIGKDGGKVGGIREPETGDVVSEDEIEDVLKAVVDGPISEIRAEIDSLENKEVIVLGETKGAKS